MAEPSAWAMERAQATERSICTPAPRLDSVAVQAHARCLDAAFLAGAEAMRTEATLTAARRGDNWTSAAIIRIDPATLPREERP